MSSTVQPAPAAAGKLMLHAHLENSESYLLAVSNVPSIAGHSLHKGTPRELFVREFLGEHLPLNLAIGTGELIDCHTEAGGKRNQHDIVIYEPSYPRIHLGGGINAFLIESVVATIEVRSTLEPEGLFDAVEAAQNAKKLQASGTLGGTHKVANYVLAYKGPAKMETAFGWLANAYQKLGLKDPDVPAHRSPTSMWSPALDGVYVLGAGACIFENNIGFLNHPDRAKAHANATWTIMNSQRGALFMLFAAMMAMSHDFTLINPWMYVRTFEVSGLQFSRIDSTPITIVPDTLAAK